MSPLSHFRNALCHRLGRWHTDTSDQRPESSPSEQGGAHGPATSQCPEAVRVPSVPWAQQHLLTPVIFSAQRNVMSRDTCCAGKGTQVGQGQEGRTVSLGKGSHTSQGVGQGSPRLQSWPACWGANPMVPWGNPKMHLPCEDRHLPGDTEVPTAGRSPHRHRHRSPFTCTFAIGSL